MKKYTVKDVMDMFDVSENTVKRWICKEYLAFELENNKNVVFTEKNIEDFKEIGKKKGFQVLK